MSRAPRIAGVALLCALSAAAAVAGVEIARDDEPAPAATEAGAPAPELFVREAGSEASGLGFPAFATANTTRIGGADPAVTAAGAALAANPSTGGVDGPDAVVLVDSADWHGALAAAVLVASPLGAPVLFSEPEEVPEPTSLALEQLAPQGAARLDGAQIVAIGDVAAPEELEELRLEAGDPAELAAEIALTRRRVAGERAPHVVAVALDAPAKAMPAAAWAARSGDPILFVERGAVPEATREALRREGRPRVYVLGGDDDVEQRTVRRLGAVSESVTRVGDPDPVASSIAFARFVDGSFGWNINDPGHGISIASTTRPIDAAAAAPLAASGQWGPLLVADQPGPLPGALRDYLLDLKPGFIDDPTRAVTNHVWILGDAEAISVEAQAQVDEIVALAPVRGGTGDRPDPDAAARAEDRLLRPR